jgi:protein-S-isoprenylcysteine O-methyltransferase Ste14
MMANKDNSSPIHSHGNHDHRKDLCEEHPYGHVGQITGIVLFLIVWLLDSFVFKVSTMPANYIPLAIRLILAGLCFLIAGYLFVASHKIIFEEHRDPPQVIDTGVFSLVRHPLYLSALLIYAGFFFTTLSLFSLLLLICIFIFYDYIARFEEKKLQEAHGEAYASYKKKTTKWFPRIRIKRHPSS